MASQETEELAAGESEPDGEGNGATQNTEGLNTGSLKDRLQSGGIADGQISQEVAKPPNSGLTTKNLTPEQRQQIINECVEDMISPTDLARKWNCNADTIRTWVRKAGLTLPKQYKKSIYPDSGSAPARAMGYGHQYHHILRKTLPGQFKYAHT